ncbi:F-box/LRR-repeat protein [Actinidia chinensis var. chinensis]|uniref:F-box/LRR-repeat protein n=1 Tax=Actinidia chinensis var. chinensis TaxID=1590841 RepID=A0A2R6QS63_ACTCC|nr:F-box/LRR-repeat protein [Actinidia chinensis var. chinensis]
METNIRSTQRRSVGLGIDFFGLEAVSLTLKSIQTQLISFQQGLEEICINAYNDDESGVNEEVLTNVTDDGVEFLASKLKELKKIDLRGKFCISDGSLVFLSLNCVKLREIHLCIYDHHLTEKGIYFVMRHCHNLTSLSLTLFPSNLDNNHAFTVGSSESYSNSFTIDNSIMKNLHTLSLVDGISVKFLYSMAKAHPPLKKLKIKSRRLVILLQACQLTLQELTLLNPYLTDRSIRNLSKYVPNLTYVSLFGYKLTSVTFYTLTKNCPLLEVIIMTSTRLGEVDNFSLDFSHENYRMRHLDVHSNTWLNDEVLKNFARVCPNLQFLDVSSCWCVTNEGIGEILKSCPVLTHLKIFWLGVSNIFERYSEHSIVNLKSLEACGTKINDESMTNIGNRCPCLRYLDISYCKGVTNNGVMEVVRNCKRIREINLNRCENVSANILPQMMFSRPSLKKITPPCGFDRVN